MTPKHFFHKYMRSSIFILLGFFLMNAILLFIFLYIFSSNTNRFSLDTPSVSSQLHADVTGQITADDTLDSLLTSQNCWAMVIANNGDVIWDLHRPSEIPDQYNISEVASFTRWYLKDYPVLTEIEPYGLLVVGYPKDSILKLNLNTSNSFVSSAIIGSLSILIVNLLFFFFLSAHNTRKLERAIVPILEGIDTISAGDSVTLPETGELSEINCKVNAASKHICQKDNARAEWINGISHDIRTPLSLILGYAGELEEDSTLSEEAHSEATIIRTQSEKLRQMISDLNLTMKLEYSMQPMHVNSIYPVDFVRQLISDFLNDYSTNSQSERYSFSFDAPMELESLAIQADKVLLTRAINNLILNAILHNPDGCSIDVTITLENELLHIDITDSGQGLTDVQLKEFNNGIFTEKEYHVTGEASHGVGLRLVSQIIKAHHGSMTFSNHTPSGLRIDIQLPVLSTVQAS